MYGMAWRPYINIIRDISAYVLSEKYLVGTALFALCGRVGGERELTPAEGGRNGRGGRKNVA